MAQELKQQEYSSLNCSHIHQDASPVAEDRWQKSGGGVTWDLTLPSSSSFLSPSPSFPARIWWVEEEEERERERDRTQMLHIGGGRDDEVNEGREGEKKLKATLGWSMKKSLQSCLKNF